ncbi:MAG TPA: SAM-dependent methyltransferase [Burkholderiales bacterium]
MPTLYAIATPLGGAPEHSLPAPALAQVRALRDFVAENAKSARAFLAAAGARPREAAIVELNEHSDLSRAADLLRPLREGRDLGLLSEAGCPAIADPGAALVEAAHREGFRVAPLVGPCALLLGLMASGLEGQRFAFCGYLPREPRERRERIRALEARSRKEHETEIFIETPYRNEALLSALLEACAPGTRLCVAADLTLATETVKTRTIAQWRRAGEAIGRRPAVFLLLAQQ